MQLKSSEGLGHSPGSRPADSPVAPASADRRPGPPANSRGPGAVTLPASVSTFVGRTEETSELAELFERSRLLTLTGPPGVGKSRLALELARQLGAAYPDGARLMELAPVGDAALVPAALAAALSVKEAPGQSVTDTLIGHLRRRSLVLVIDNCEHLVGACAELVGALLSACPELRVLATSRESLGIAGERVWQVPPLSAPGAELRDRTEATPELLMDYEAVRLFVDRASAVKPDFCLDAYVAPAVAEICRRLDGVPLAIELAAARVDMLTPAEVARRLEDRFGLLTKGSRSELPRHRTLQAALDWSHDLLSGPERALLRRLSVFVGGFELEAVEAVCSDAELEREQVFELLARLVAKSLVVTDTSNSSPARYRLLETIRAYGAERLDEAGEAPRLRQAHARFYVGLAEQAEPELTGHRQERWLERLDCERDDLRTALEWSLGHGQVEQALRLAGAVVLFWRVRCHFSEGRQLLEAVLAAGDGAAAGPQAKALWGVGFLALMAGDAEGAIPALEDSVSRFRQLGDLQGCARALLILGNAKQGLDGASVLPLLEESAALAQAAGDQWCSSHALGVAGFEHLFRGEVHTARRLLEECLTVARHAQDPQGALVGLLGRGQVALEQGDYHLAGSLLEEAVATARQLRDDYSTATALQYLGQLEFGRGDYGRAQELLNEALELMPEVGPPGPVLDTLVLLARVAHAKGDRREARRLFEETQARGTGTPLLQGMGELALDEVDLSEASRLLENARDLAQSTGDRGSLARALHGLGHLARAAGDAKRAVALHHEALDLQREIGDAAGIAPSLEAVAGLAAATERWDHAARMLGAAQSLRAGQGYARAPWESSRYEADAARIRQALLAEELEAAFSQGRQLPIEEALLQAAKGRGRQGRTASGWASLTATERQVAALVAEGLTNREIAERMFTAPGTVKNHLFHIFRKLGIAKRRELELEVRRREQS